VTGRLCGPRLPRPDAELYTRAHMTILAISRDLTIFQIESLNFPIESQIESQCFKSNLYISTESPKWFKSQFKSQSQLGVAHHCYSDNRYSFNIHRNGHWTGLCRNIIQFDDDDDDDDSDGDAVIAVHRYSKTIYHSSLRLIHRCSRDPGHKPSAEKYKRLIRCT